MLNIGLMQGFAGLSLFSRAAADGPGPGDHLRPDGRHQHGAWRVHDHRRLHHLPRLARCPRSYAPGFMRPTTSRSPSSLAFVLAFVAGWLVEWALIRHLYKRPLDTLLATWGLSLVMQQIFRSVFGAEGSQPDAARLADGLLGAAPRAWTSRSTACSCMALTAARHRRRAARAVPRRWGLRVRATVANRVMANADRHQHAARPTA